MMDRQIGDGQARMRAEHWGRTDEWGRLNKQFCARDGALCPCDAARLPDHFAPGPVLHLAGLAYGLCGPSDENELART